MIYLATPHAQHTELALKAIEAGKALLVEKAFTANVADTTAVIEAARRRGVFAMEAMWTRFLPAVTHLREMVASGELGEIRAVYGDLLAFREFEPSDRLFNPVLGGGAVLDLGVCVISFAQQFLGTPELVHAVGGVYPNGVEGQAASCSAGRTAATPPRRSGSPHPGRVARWWPAPRVGWRSIRASTGPRTCRCTCWALIPSN